MTKEQNLEIEEMRKHAVEVEQKLKDAELCLAAHEGDDDLVSRLLADGANVHAKNDVAIRMAAQNGHRDVVRRLRNNGANVRANSDSALRWAAKNGHRDVVFDLLVISYNGSSIADIHANDDDALRSAASNGGSRLI